MNVLTSGRFMIRGSTVVVEVDRIDDTESVPVTDGMHTVEDQLFTLVPIKHRRLRQPQRS